VVASHRRHVGDAGRVASGSPVGSVGNDSADPGELCAV
jgi:hypothetical protein